MKDQNKLSLMERLTAPTPKLFVIIQTIGGILVALSLAVKNLPAQGVSVPDSILFLADKAYVLAGAVAALVAQFTVDFAKRSHKGLLDKIVSRR